MFPVQTSRMLKAEDVCPGMTGSLRSVRPGAAQHRAGGLPENHEVERERPVLDVADVDAHRVVPGEIRAAADLPQAGETGLDQEASVHVVAVLLDLALQRRARPDQRHAAAE